MKKIAFTVLAFALASFATLNAQTITKRILLSQNKTNPSGNYASDGHGGRIIVNSEIRLGNSYYSGKWFTPFNLYEIDISSESIGIVDSIACRQFGNFTTPNNGEVEVPSDLGAFCIEIFTGGTGDAEADYNGSKLTSVGKFSGLTTEGFKTGLNFSDLNLDLSGEDYFTVAIAIDTSLIPEMPSGGMGIKGPSSILFTLTETQAIPEPSTYAAIFGALVLGFVIYRRRK